MFLNHKFGYSESFDFTTLPEYQALRPEQQTIVKEQFEQTVRHYDYLGTKVAIGKAYQTALRAIQEQAAIKPKESAPPISIFSHLS